MPPIVKERTGHRRKQATSTRRKAAPAESEQWYQNAIIYELHVRAFHDSNNDGIGDFRGLTEKLDYLQDLGITAIWMLPFYPSPLRDDGYDIADYTGVNPSYGTMRDVRRFIREAHKRGIRVINELVINHTSDQHKWFQRARHAPPGSSERDFYVWSDSPDKYSDTRIIFQDFESSNWTWDPVAKSYFWHRFYSHQPDLNYDNPAVHEAVFKVMRHWFDAGIDGMRLDAVPYLFEREGTNCENLPETHEFLRKLRQHVDQNFDDKMFLAEANQWPEDAAAYFGDGDECHMNFHFPLMPRLFMALRMEDRFPIIDILDQTPQIPDACQWALFLRNHDELTLEMVTDEERDYMYRVYAEDRQARINLGIRRRLAPLLRNNRRKIELLNALLFSLPGTPVIYYGDEIGMGDNIYLGDRDSVRTPMQWSADRNAGFSRANPQQLYLPVIIDPEYRYEAVNVESQQNNPTSLLWWMKRLIGLRKRYRVFGTGSIEFLDPENHKVLAFVREDEDDTILIVANLSRYVQAVELDLARYQGRIPVELFGQTPFPPVGELPYFVTLGPHSFYWFSVERRREVVTLQADEKNSADGYERATLETSTELAKWLTSSGGVSQLERVLTDDIPRRRWFRSKAQKIRDTHIVDRIPIPVDQAAGMMQAALVLIEFEFVEGEPETYAVPLALADAAHTAFVFGGDSPSVIAKVAHRKNDDTALLYDAMVDPAFCSTLLAAVADKRKFKGKSGQVDATTGRAVETAADNLEVHVPRAEQTNSSVVFGDQLIMKLYRAVSAGINPDVEITRHLTDNVEFEHTPAFAGSIEYTADDKAKYTLAMLQRFTPNEGDGWRHMLDQIAQFYEHLLTSDATQKQSLPVGNKRLIDLLQEQIPDVAHEFLSNDLYLCALLGQRTAEMHVALATSGGNKDFKPEPFSQLYQRSLYQSLRNSARRSVQLLRNRLRQFPEGVRADAKAVLDHEKELVERLKDVSRKPISGQRTRCHGDYHLGQVLWTGRDFVIIDYEGEPARPLSERRLKWTPLRDVAGMIRSFQYAAYTALQRAHERGAIQALPEREETFANWARTWETCASTAFLKSYLQHMRDAAPNVLPKDDEAVATLLNAWLLEKAMYEVRYELNNRPDWVHIPLRGVMEILDISAD